MSEEQDDKRTKKNGLVENPVFPFEGAEYDTVPRADVIKLMADVKGVSVEEMTDAAKGGAVFYPGASVIKGPEKYGLTDVEYFQKLAGVIDAPQTAEEREIEFLGALTEDEIAQFVKDIENGVKSYRYIGLLNNELSSRGMFHVETTFKSSIEIKKGDCCDGSMFHFNNSGAEVCVVPPSFTEIEELNGDIICINRAPKDKKLPGELRIMGDGAENTYFSRKAIPYWLHTLIRESIKNDPATAETRKQLWAQMEEAVNKRPRKKKDGTSRSALSELHPSLADRKKQARVWNKEFKQSLKKTKEILRQHAEENKLPEKFLQPVDMHELQSIVRDELHKK